ncbi:integrator complex subunit 12-like [Lineus longissimus]|uniref:integrator complex subunit 12-like n=1 Tax=Lineus longissimus TaxID=88925 RepID=UPI002B4CB324
MAALMELDPIFVKALKLLHSKAKDSAAQLKQMVDDSITQKKGRSRDNSPKPSLITTKSSYGQSGAKPDFDEIRKREIEKRNFEKVNKDLSDLVQPPEPKKPKLEPKPNVDIKKEVQEHKVKTYKDKDPPRDKFEEKYEKKVKTEPVKPEPKPERKRIIVPEDDSSSSDDLGMDADDFAVDMGIACVVCRQFDSSAANQLVECQECHSLYHQQCHKPNVSSQDVNDPRFVWYCSKCQKNMKKIVTTKSQKTKPVTPSPSSAGSFLFPKDSGTKSTSSLSSKPSPTETPFQAFKRLAEAKAAGSSSSGGSKPFVGLAGLAANLSGKTSESSKSSKIADTKSSKSFESLKYTSKSSDSLKTKQSESKLSKSSSSGGISVKSSSSTGLAKLASSVTSSSSSGGSKSGSVSSSGSGSAKSSASQLSRSNSGGASQAMAAEKKLQMMKKKAAAKLQERRK